MNQNFEKAFAINSITAGVWLSIIFLICSTPVEAQSVQSLIEKNGKLPGGSARKKLVEGKFGKSVQKKVIAKSGAASCSTFDQVGDQPEGFGYNFNWCGNDEATLVAYINAADQLGISITGVKAGDYVSISSASGIASFSEDKGNPTASSIVGFVGTVGKLIAPEFAPVIAAGEKFAQNQFKPTNAKTKRRDAFGVDPGSGHKAREEGGIVVCMPSQGGAVYSGNEDHEERWIKANETRFDQYRPAHALYSFFLVQGDSYNTRQSIADGEIQILPWDWKFEDNAGYYKVFIHLKRGTLASPVLTRPR